MRAAFVIGTLGQGGAERVMSNLANYLVRQNHEITIITLFRREPSYWLDPRVTVINGLDISIKLNAIRLLRQQIKKTTPDIVLSFMTHINILTIVAMWGLDIPVVVSERSDPKEHPSQYMRRFLRRILYPWPKGFVFQTKNAQEYFPSNIVKRSIVIPNPIYFDRKEKTKDQFREDVIVTVGRLTKAKNHRMLIRAFGEIHKRFPTYVLKIFGEGDLREELKEYVSLLDLDGPVRLMGSSNTIIKEIDKCKIFVLSSDYEGMPNALIEALAVGLPSISTNCLSGGPEFLLSNGRGILVPVGDEQALTEAISYLIQHPQERELMGEQAMSIFELLNPRIVFRDWEIYLLENCRRRKR